MSGAAPPAPDPVARDEGGRSESEPGRRGLSTLAVRTLTGIVLVLVLAAVIAAGLYAMAVAVTVVGGVALWEYRRLTARLGFPAPAAVLYPLGLYIAFSGTLLARVPPSIAIGVALVAGLTGMVFLPNARGGVAGWGMAVAGALYVGLPLNALLVLFSRYPAPTGTLWLAALIATAVAGDTVAFLVGRRWGRRPFFPEVSPNKSLEGAIAGWLAAFAVMLAAGMFPLHLPAAHAAVLGALIAAGAEAGDLVESQLKRAAAVKDSSNLIPGHGGVLDRIDSMLLSPVIAIVYLTVAGLLPR